LIGVIVKLAIKKDTVLKEKKITIREDQAMLRFSGGDARKLLNVLELVVLGEENEKIVISNSDNFASDPTLYDMEREIFELEDDMAEWLEDQGVEDGYDFAPVFIENKLETADLEQMTNNIRSRDIPTVMDWVLNVLTSKSLVDEINYSSARISDLVSSIKSYTHMDRGTEMEPLDVTDGINNTLKMLGHKLKQKQINTELNFPDLIPKISGRTGSLNQVWANIIDNAIDAMDKEGNLKISIEQDADRLMVTIQDDGPGIPKDIQSNIFDPFFTTKKIGEGTGMGLDIVNRIIRNHHGEIKLQSLPGKTKFIFYFPLMDGTKNA